ncbi:hypothetical protein OSB04_007423 [Centaurea solstitialis]|uniref:SAP domain-containing protein n=1 Tax=Centaurea solstitialis TaxID=347529 RepID=A0AA38TSF3_9ASTR|nr:hypothetical protein OSB04_007423 [Centaurea solstitialis]
MKPNVISISSDDDEDEEEDEELQSEYSSTDDGDDNDSDDQDYDYDDDEDENDAESDVEESFHELSDKPLSFHQGSNDSQEPSLNECKAYLRKHGLRLSGTKEECVQRMKEHGRLKEGRGESLYPRSSFSINCTGDACKGDVVLFTQKVYNKFDKASRRGDVVGKRTVAGRIVKESYGASKQQHTFTIEVLWSKGPQKLSPLSPLLVKGRNLYRFRTLRQPWKSEAERSKVLGEKHKRGEAARHKRKLKKTEIASKNNEGRKRQKVSDRRPSTLTDKHKSGKKRVNRRKKELETSQATFRADPNRCVYSDHRRHLQQASSSSSIPYRPTSNLPPPRFPGYHGHPPLGFPGYHGHYYNNGVPLLRDHVLYRPPGYNYDQPFPRYRFG